MSDPKIVQHPSSDTTPETFCAMLLENAPQISHLACVVQWKDGNTDVFKTTMRNDEVTWLRWVFDQYFRPD